MSPELWVRVQERLGNIRRTYTARTKGKLWASPGAAVESKHLLLGLATCQQCGGSIAVHGRSHGVGKTRRRAYFYACRARWDRGPAVCSNDLVVPATMAEDGILSALEQQFMHPEIISRAIAQVRAAFTRPSTAERPQAVARELARVDGQLERVIDAVQNGGGERSARWSSGCGAWNSAAGNYGPSASVSGAPLAPPPPISPQRSRRTSWRGSTTGRDCCAAIPIRCASGSPSSSPSA